MQAHIPTMFLMVIVVSLTMAVCTAALWRREQPEGLGYWTLALALHGVAFILFSLREDIHVYLSVVVANVLLACVFALFCEAILQFQQQRMQRLWLWWPALAVVPIFLALLDYQAARVVASAVLSLYQAVMLLIIMLGHRDRTQGRGQYFVMAAAMLAIATMAYRGVGTALGMEHMLLLSSSNPIQMATFLVSCIFLILSSMGLVLMTKERADAQNRKLAMHDELTGLPNRRYSMSVLTSLLAGLSRGQQPLSLMMLDVDHFKRINDNHGHLTGDRSLKLLADTLRLRLRAQDHAGRLGGEEFLLILPNTNASGALELAETLRLTVEQRRFNSSDQNPLSITVSIGVCTLEPSSELNTQQAIGLADMALYRAKQNGRNRVETAG